MIWYYEACLKNKGDESVVWNCTSCSKMPNNILDILSELRGLRDDIKSLKKDHQESSKLIKKLTTESEDLKKDSNTLKSQITQLSLQLQQKSWEYFTSSSTKSLLEGDSFIRDVDESKLVMTKVTSLPGAKVTDILKHLEEDEEKYRSITCCVGTNDCAEDTFDADALAKSYRDVITAAKAKVNDPKDVFVVTVPPRTDSSKFQEKVDVINANLASIVRDDDITFINNDPTFKLGDNTVNDGYLLSDGLHMNSTIQPLLILALCRVGAGAVAARRFRFLSPVLPIRIGQ